jgi:hypothetical protein
VSREGKEKGRSKKRPASSAQNGGARKRSGDGAASRAKFRDRIAIAIIAALLIPMAVVGFVSLSRSGQPDQHSAVPTTAGSAPGSKTAAIVDQLALTQPNPAFIETTTRLLEQAGYAVDYYPDEEVTVDFYRNLPTLGYELLILRNHSSLVATVGAVTDAAGLYTSEPYSENEYVDDQVAWRLLVAKYYEGGPEYFAIAPGFVGSSMRGQFNDTTVILMGCDGLKSDTLAEALVQRGAKWVVSWSGPVSAPHTEAATERLLHHLLEDRLTIQQAVTQTVAEVGPDPTYGARLLLYPSESVATPR